MGNLQSMAHNCSVYGSTSSLTVLRCYVTTVIVAPLVIIQLLLKITCCIIAPETLLSLNHWGWRSQTKESIMSGLGTLEHCWTNEPWAKNRMATIQPKSLAPSHSWWQKTTNRSKLVWK